MSNQKVRTVPDLAHHKELDPRAWAFNVADKFKGMNPDDIKAYLMQTAASFAVCFENWVGDFNMATGIRNANAFNAKEVFYVGNKRWDRRGAVGVHNYTNVHWIHSIDEFKRLSESYVVIGVDNIPGSVSMSNFQWPENTLMVFGEEGCGLTPGMQELCKHIVHIDMFGTVRSLNCGTASGIAMFSYTQQNKR